MNSSEILRNAAYEEGRKAGRAEIAKEILEDIEEILISKLDTFNKLQENPSLADPNTHEAEYWQGRAVTCGEILQIISRKKKYEYKVG